MFIIRLIVGYVLYWRECFVVNTVEALAYQRPVHILT
jgi:hypothetical protein